MNKITKISLSLVALVAIAVGCATQNASQQALEQTAIISAASLGTMYDLQKNPKDLPYFTAAQSVLTVVSGETNIINASSIEGALSAAGQTNAVVNLAVLDAINLGDAYIASESSSTNAVSTSEAIKNVALYVSEGIGQGIAASK
jgi:hypothetical protein